VWRARRSRARDIGRHARGVVLERGPEREGVRDAGGEVSVSRARDLARGGAELER